jgi:hypothetical protein
LGVGPLSAPDPDFGANVRGGTWLVREIVQPLVDVGWSRSVDGSLVLDGVRFGAGAAFGSPLARRRLWAGASVLPRAAWTRAADRRAVSKWRSSTELAGLLQIRGRWWMIGVRVGADLTFPPVRARGHDRDDTVRWGPVRFVSGLDLAFVFPWGGPTASP